MLHSSSKDMLLVYCIMIMSEYDIIASDVFMVPHVSAVTRYSVTAPTRGRTAAWNRLMTAGARLGRAAWAVRDSLVSAVLSPAVSSHQASQSVFLHTDYHPITPNNGNSETQTSCNTFLSENMSTK